MAGFSMKIIPTSKLDAYRAQTFRTSAAMKLANPQQAVDYVNERGFIFFWPVKGMCFQACGRL